MPAPVFCVFLGRRRCLRAAERRLWHGGFSTDRRDGFGAAAAVRLLCRVRHRGACMDREKQTVLVVDDQSVNRQILRHMLQADYEVVEAENGDQALKLLKAEHRISAVVLDIMMPVMDGYAFLRMLGAAALSALPVIAVTATKDEAAEQKALDLGAWDFISKPYHAAVLRARLKNVIVRSQFYLVNEMRHAYEHDALTDLYNRTGFFAQTRRLLEQYPDRTFAILRFDIDDFHLLNAFWGEEEGNRFLRFLADGVRKVAEQAQPSTYGRINADTFSLCIAYRKGWIEKTMETVRAGLAAYNTNYLIEPSLGVYVVSDRTVKTETMYEYATLAAQECKGKYETYLRYYEPEMSRRAEQEQGIVSEMQAALEGGQFEVFLQPKYNLENEKPYGAEALIRWRHPERGLLAPGLFIPVFEGNGFIGKVDHYMWEQVCILLRRWIDAGEHPAPISVNVSRVNMYNPNLVRVLQDLVKKYAIDPSLLNLELTETAYMDDPELMSRVVHELRQAGFVVMMDDFGSGYSSLNTLKDIPVDVLKIDMKFLSSEHSSGRNECILASVIRMAGWLQIPVIMEGVEELQQVEFLKSIGCGYVQGYFYARPMPVADYEKLVHGVQQEPVRSRSENHRAIFETVWASSPQMNLLFSSIPQPIAIYEFANDSFRALRVNEAFNRFFGYGSLSSHENADLLSSELPIRQLSRLTAACRRTAAEHVPVDDSFALPNGRRVHIELQYWGANEKSAILFASFSEEKEAGDILRT